MSMPYQDENERLVAEQAVAVYRAVVKAMEHAPHGHGLACMEEALLKEGRGHLQELLSRAMSTHPEVQKGGPAASPARAERKPRSSTTRKKRSSRPQAM